MPEHVTGRGPAHLVLSKGLLHLREGGGEFSNEVVFPAGVVVPDQALWGPGPSAACPKGQPGVPTPVPPAPGTISTFRGLVSWQLHREFSDTLKGSHTGLRLFLTTCGSSGGCLRPRAEPLDLIPWVTFVTSDMALDHPAPFP